MRSALSLAAFPGANSSFFGQTAGASRLVSVASFRPVVVLAAALVLRSFYFQVL